MTIIDILYTPAFGRMLLTNTTALDAGMLCIVRVLNCLSLGIKKFAQDSHRLVTD